MRWVPRSALLRRLIGSVMAEQLCCWPARSQESAALSALSHLRAHLLTLPAAVPPQPAAVDGAATSGQQETLGGGEGEGDAAALGGWLPIWQMPHADSFGDAKLEHAWSESPADIFKVRSQGYLQDRIKQPSAPSSFSLRCVLIVPSIDKLHHIAEVHPLPPRPAGAPLRLVIMFQVPGTPRLHLVLCFERSLSADEGLDARDLRAFRNLLARCTAPAGVEMLSGRLKIVPNLAEGGGMLVRRAVGNKPAIVANGMLQAQYVGDGYVEIDIDVEVSPVAKHLLGLVKPLSRSIALDLAFLIEGQDEAELPERLIGGARLHRINLDRVIADWARFNRS